MTKHPYLWYSFTLVVTSIVPYYVGLFAGRAQQVARYAKSHICPVCDQRGRFAWWTFKGQRLANRIPFIGKYATAFMMGFWYQHTIKEGIAYHARNS
jgi:hypothetical protein